jgi:hypothetical protein
MALDMTQGFEFFKSFLVDVTVFNIDWIISLFVIVLVLLLISRDTQDWKILSLPVTIVIHIMGLTPSFIWYIIATIIFSVELFSTRMMGNVLHVFDKKPRQSVEDKLFQKQFKQDKMKAIRTLGTKDWMQYMNYKNKRK